MLKDNDVVIGKPYKHKITGRVGILNCSSLSHRGNPVYTIQWTDHTNEVYTKFDFIETFLKVTKEQYDDIYHF